MADELVKETQVYLNQTYGGRSGWVKLGEDGLTGWGTIRGLTRALQYELGLTADGVFGDGTLGKCPTINEKTANKNLIRIVQGGLICKGYGADSPNGAGTYGAATKNAVRALQTDANVPDKSGEAYPQIVKGLMSMDAYKLIRAGSASIREVQQRLNNKYFAYTGLRPADGVYTAGTNRALIMALQVETPGNHAVDGIWGGGTFQDIPNGTPSDGTNLAILAQCALRVNGYSVPLTGFLGSSDTRDQVLKFQRFMMIGVDGVIGRRTWAALLVSYGDKTRPAYGADFAVAATVAVMNGAFDAVHLHNGHEETDELKVIGRYLTTLKDTETKQALTRQEFQEASNRGLRIFPIYQTGGRSITDFTAAKGKSDAAAAVTAATKIGFTTNAIIYFAVDLDVTDDQITSNVLPYLSAVRSYMTSLGTKGYKVGVYGSRNVGIRANDLIEAAFVSDMSSGFSGNLGFPLPPKWAFDQFANVNAHRWYTDPEGNRVDGKDFDIDLVIIQGRDPGQALPVTS
ncbi:DUF1906 domain-containing protein [Saxibacter everestensis]|uniref:DUF1906 domain-containing protein n=1 Tax=Saxibacter everestensis TaxID=2909229 RepID=A0ABY8QTW1_9MICO|nr:DUF1906 domain-containing protein [Brevibacteriaceae bacterium ZFBP1038]